MVRFFFGHCAISLALLILLLINRLTADEKYDLVRSIGEECIQEDELRRLLANKPNPIAYDGFEPSGRMHIAQVRSILCRI